MAWGAGRGSVVGRRLPMQRRHLAFVTTPRLVDVYRKYITCLLYNRLTYFLQYYMSMINPAENARPTLRSRPDQRLRELVELMRDGSSHQIKRAQTEFYKELRRQLGRTSAARYLGHAAFDDVFQITVVAVWDSLDSFRGDASLVTWVHSIFKNKIKDAARSYHVRMVEPLSDDESFVCGERDVPELLGKEQVVRFLLDCLETLRAKAPRRAQVIELVRLEYSINEIADIMDAPSGTVKRWASEARDALERCIRRHGAHSAQG